MKQQKFNQVEKIENPLKIALDKCRAAFKVVFVFAFFINLLMLVTPLYSLQVLDRVIGSGNLETLLMLSIIIACVYFVHMLLQIARSFTLIKVGEWLDNNLSPIIFGHSISASATKVNPEPSQMLRDFQTVKTFLTSTGINTLFDAPWSIVYIIVIFLIHPYIGFITVAGAIIIVSFAFFNAVATNRTLGEATESSIKSMTQADIANRNAEAVEAMGMISKGSKETAPPPTPPAVLAVETEEEPEVEEIEEVTVETVIETDEDLLVAFCCIKSSINAVKNSWLSVV